MLALPHRALRSEPPPAPSLPPRLGASGVRREDFVAVLGVYAAPFAAFGVFFATPNTGLTLFVIVVLAMMYFGLLGGGLLLAGDRRAAGPGRSFAEFLGGRRCLARGRVIGREALGQMIALPAILLGGALVFSVIWRIVGA